MPRVQRACDQCETEYTATRSTSRFCSAACRSAAARERRTAIAEPEPAAVEAPGADEPRRTAVEQMVRQKLDEARRTDTVDGQSALALAIRIDERQDSGSGLASLVNALRATLALALTGATGPSEDEQPPATGDPIIDLQERRERRRGTS